MKLAHNLPKDQLDTITPEELEAYLISHGWKFIPVASDEKVHIYRHPQDHTSEIWVPINRSFTDYAKRVAEVMLALGEAESRPFWHVFLEFVPEAHPAHAAENGSIKSRNGSKTSQAKPKRKRGSVKASSDK